MAVKKVKKSGSKPVKLIKKLPIPEKIVKYLDASGIKHEILEHKSVYTAIDAAMTMKRRLDEIAKSLLIKADQDYFLIIVPADNNLDFEKLKMFLTKLKNKEVKAIKIPGEKVIESALKIKAGTLSAFGGLHKVGVVMDKKFGKLKKAIFSSGSLNHSIEMLVKDFINMENVQLANIEVKKKIKKQKTTAPKKMKPAKKKAGAKPKKRIPAKRR